MAASDCKIIYNKHAEDIIEYYNDFVVHTQKILFPSWKFSFIEVPDLQGLGKTQALLAKIFAPYPLPGNSFSTSYFIWIIVFLMWIATIIASMEPATARTGTTSSPPGFWLSIAVVCLLVLLPLFLYCYSLWFLVTKKVSWKTRVAWFASFFLVLLYFYAQFKKLPRDELLALYNPPFTQFLLCFMIIPAILFIVFNLLFFGKFIIELIINLFNSFVYSHQPVSYKLLRQVTTSSIQSKISSWHLSDLSVAEIKTLKELATNNLEATEKKTLPVVILIGIFGFLVALPVLQQSFGRAVEETVNWILEVVIISRNAPNMTFGRIIFDLALLFMLTFVVAAYAYLFQNLIIQGVAVQACTIAEYSKAQIEQMVLQRKNNSSFIYRFLKTLIRFTHFMMGNNKY